MKEVKIDVDWKLSLGLKDLRRLQGVLKYAISIHGCDLR